MKDPDTRYRPACFGSVPCVHHLRIKIRRNRLFCDLAQFISVPCTVFDFILQATEVFFRILPPQIGIWIHQQLIKRTVSKLLLRSVQWQVIDLLETREDMLLLFFQHGFKSHPLSPSVFITFFSTHCLCLQNHLAIIH